MKPVNIDWAKQCSPKYMRMTARLFPKNLALAQKAKIPAACIISPLAGPPANKTELVPIVNFGACGVIRCKQCRTYINPYVQFLDNGNLWKCNVCGLKNRVPPAYFNHLDRNGKRQDLATRPELLKGQVEIQAPAEYMVRPPQAPVYVFAIDVSYTAVSSGMLAACVDAIRAALDKLPGSPRTQVAFITYDSSVHFYNLTDTLAAPQMIVMPDVNDVFVPLPDDLLVNLKDSREMVDVLLDSLPSLFEHTHDMEACMGAAIECAFRLMTHIGGKLCLFQSSLPSVGIGSLKVRVAARGKGTQPAQTLQPVKEFYEQKAKKLSGSQISCDVFLFSDKYTDVATLSHLVKNTSGELYYYPGFHASTHQERFGNDLVRDLTRATGFESVMRVRCSKGVKISAFHGNLTMRAKDLLAIPCVHADSTYTVELQHDSAAPIKGDTVYIQCALLYTTSGGDRRIRVNTLAVPLCHTVQQLVSSVDVDAVCNVIAKQAAVKVVTDSLSNALASVKNSCMAILRGSGGGVGTQVSSISAAKQRVIPAQLRNLPLYCMALCKNMMLRKGNVQDDIRAFLVHRMGCMPVHLSRVVIYPRMFALHRLEAKDGTQVPPGEAGGEGRLRIKMPNVLQLSNEQLTSDGIFLLDNGLQIYIWIGSSAAPQSLHNLFQIQGLHPGQAHTLRLRLLDNDFSRRVNNIVRTIRADRGIYPGIMCIREGDPIEAEFMSNLYNDRMAFPGGQTSFREFAAIVQRNTGMSLAPH